MVSAFICFSKVLEHIRLSLISPYYLHDVIESLDVVKESQGCQKLISEAKDYLLLKDRRAELYSLRARPRRSTGKSTRTRDKVYYVFWCFPQAEFLRIID